MFLTLLLIVCCCCATVSLSADDQEGVTDVKFRKVTSREYGSQRLRRHWLNQSLVNCVLKCRSLRQCQTILYNGDSGLCTPGSFLKSGRLGAALAPNSTGGDLFAPSTCDTSDGFTHVTSGAMSACLWTSDFSANYEDARAFCLERGAHLFTAHVIERARLLTHNKTFMIGLTDIDMEGVFVWDDDGEVMGQTYLSSFFKSGEPNNAGGREDCVTIVGGTEKNSGNDFECDGSPRDFVCERPMIG